MGLNEYTREEVAKHNRMGDIWFIIHKYVYNVTEFIYEHPGGQEAHLRVAGKDASQCFDEVGHSDEAEILMKKFRIGVVTETGSASSAVRLLVVSKGENMHGEFQTVTQTKHLRDLFIR